MPTFKRRKNHLEMDIENRNGNEQHQRRINQTEYAISADDCGKMVNRSPKSQWPSAGFYPFLVSSSLRYHFLIGNQTVLVGLSHAGYQSTYANELPIAHEIRFNQLTALFMAVYRHRYSVS